MTDLIERPEIDTSLATIVPHSVESLLSLAIEKGATVETLERLMSIRREMRAEQAKEAFDDAMRSFQAECPIILKDKEVYNKDGRTVRFRYAPLDSIVAQVRGLLAKHGFSHSEDSSVEAGWVTGVCTATHRLGHSKTTSFKVPINKDGFMSEMQHYSSALTFAMRRAFCNAFGILTGDEDREDPPPPSPTPDADPTAPKVPTREQRQADPKPAGAPDQAQALNQLFSRWNAANPSDAPLADRKLRFAKWAGVTLKTPNNMEKASNWTPDAIQVCEEALR